MKFEGHTLWFCVVWGSCEPADDTWHYYVPCHRNYIIDAQSVERNWILVATHCPGGPNERVLPPHTLTVSTMLAHYKATHSLVQCTNTDTAPTGTYEQFVAMFLDFLRGRSRQQNNTFTYKWCIYVCIS